MHSLYIVRSNRIANRITIRIRRLSSRTSKVMDLNIRDTIIYLDRVNNLNLLANTNRTIPVQLRSIELNLTDLFTCLLYTSPSPRDS